MAKIIEFPTPIKDQNTEEKKGFNLNEFLNRHTGCDYRKMINGDPEEIKKMERHFQKETLKVRSRLLT